MPKLVVVVARVLRFIRNCRSRVSANAKPLTVGDIVLLADPNTPRGVWPLGRIISAYPGSDGIIRVATVKTKTGTYLRPVAKMCLLEAHKSADESSLPEDKKSLGK